jgi:hypothetical protein
MRKNFCVYNSTKLDIEMDIMNVDRTWKEIFTITNRSSRCRSRSFNRGNNSRFSVHDSNFAEKGANKKLVGPEYLTLKIRSLDDLRELRKILSDDLYCGTGLGPITLHSISQL